MALGALAMDIGALTVFVWALREREKLYDIFDVLTGVRFTVELHANRRHGAGYCGRFHHDDPRFS